MKTARWSARSTIGKNVAKYVAIDANESRSPISLLSSGTAGDGTWDGTRYDIATGEYVMCDEGQYTLRIRARMPGSHRVETTLLPVKLDLTAPQVHITSAAVDDGMLYLTYTAQDYSGIPQYRCRVRQRPGGAGLCSRQ